MSTSVRHVVQLSINHFSLFQQGIEVCYNSYEGQPIIATVRNYWFLSPLTQNKLRKKFMPELRWVVKQSKHVLKKTWKKACRVRRVKK